jgi:uncharacterized protein (TIGR02145 family)
MARLFTIIFILIFQLQAIYPQSSEEKTFFDPHLKVQIALDSSRKQIIYSQVKIGDQIWMSKNLNTLYFSDGILIPEAASAEEWELANKQGKAVWTNYEYDPEYGKFYGKLYNRYAVNNKRGLCPTGWKIPSESDWGKLELQLGMTDELVKEFGWRGNAAGKLKSAKTAPAPHPRWDSPNSGATNETGFSALPGGYLTGKPNYEEQEENSFRLLGREAVFWSAEGGGRGLWNDRVEIFRGGTGLTNNFGFSVRCIKE